MGSADRVRKAKTNDGVMVVPPGGLAKRNYTPRREDGLFGLYDRQMYKGNGPKRLLRAAGAWTCDFQVEQTVVRIPVSETGWRKDAPSLIGIGDTPRAA